MMVEVTQADIDAAKLYEFCAANELALAFAAHQMLGREEARQTDISAQLYGYNAGRIEGRRQMREEAAAVSFCGRHGVIAAKAILAIPIGDE